MIKQKMINGMPGYRRNGCGGFTLIELLIAMLVGSIVMAAVMTSFQSQHRTYLAQDEVVAMQQNLRMAIDVLSRDIRMAGYNPTRQIDNFVFVDGVAFNNGGAVNTAVSTNASQIAFRADLDGDGLIDFAAQDANGDGTTDMSDMEQIAIRLNGTTLQRYTTVSGAINWQALVDNIEAVEFLYVLADNTTTTTPTAVQLPDIRSVRMTVLARAAAIAQGYTDTKIYTPASGVAFNGGNPFNDGLRRQMLTTPVQCRNMGL